MSIQMRGVTNMTHLVISSSVNTWQGDSKLAGKSGDVSVKKDALGPHGGASGTSAQGVSMPVFLFIL